MSTLPATQRNCLVSYADIVVDQDIYSEGIDSFTNSVSKHLYELGRLLTTPWSAGIGKVVQLWNDPSGQKIKSVFLAFCLVVTSPLAIPGLLLRLGLFSFRNPFAFKPGAFSENVERDLNILTWNVALNPKFISAAIHLAYPENRIEMIMTTIAEQKPLVICLQEVYDLDAIKVLETRLSNCGYDCVHSINSTGLGVNSGLFVAVKRTPIARLERIASWKFDNTENKDYWSSKGLVGVKLAMREGKTLNIFNTHLQASYGKEGKASIRAEQVASIVQARQEWTGRERNTASILLGDFNFAENPLEIGDISGEYPQQLATLSAAGLLPVSIKNPNGTYINPKTVENTISMIDNVFMTENLGPHSLTIVTNPSLDVELRSSDHRPVVWHTSSPQ